MCIDSSFILGAWGLVREQLGILCLDMPAAGEESKVTIVSLVRSNPDGKAGFLVTDNRINVLLSR